MISKTDYILAISVCLFGGLICGMLLGHIGCNYMWKKLLIYEGFIYHALPSGEFKILKLETIKKEKYEKTEE